MKKGKTGNGEMVGMGPTKLAEKSTCSKQPRLVDCRIGVI